MVRSIRWSVQSSLGLLPGLTPDHCFEALLDQALLLRGHCPDLSPDHGFSLLLVKYLQGVQDSQPQGLVPTPDGHQLQDACMSAALKSVAWDNGMPSAAAEKLNTNITADQGLKIKLLQVKAGHPARQGPKELALGIAVSKSV